MSARLLDTYRDADGLPVTAAFAAYMIENGYRTYREAQDSDGFVLWQAERWEEFCSAHGIGTLIAPDPSDRARFTAWLDGRAVDQTAQRAVEAA